MKIDSTHIDVRIKLLELAFKYLFASSIALALNAFIIVIALWGIVEHNTLIIWFSTLSSLILVRFFHAKTNLPKLNSLNIISKEFQFKFLAIITVLLFSFGILFFLPDDLTYQSFITMILTGIAAGSIMSLSFYKKLVISYITILLLPFAILLTTFENDLQYLISILIFIFIIMLSRFATFYHKSIIDVIITKIELQDSKKETQLSKEYFKTMFEQAPVGVFTYDKELILKESNETLASILHVKTKDLINMDLKRLTDDSLRPALEIILSGEKGFYEGNYRSKIAKLDLSISLQTAPLYDKDNKIKGGLAILNDITQRVKSEQKIRYQAFYDHLTGLANRLTLQDRLEQQISRLIRHKNYGAIIFIDIDHFKTINDSLGHDIGDELLKQFAARMVKTIRKEDTFSRLGGDEFVILLSELSSSLAEATELAYQISQKCHNLMSTPFIIDNHVLHITLSQGITMIGDKDININTVLKNADIAMYEAKKAGRANSKFFQESMTEQIHQQLLLDNDLRKAIIENEFELYFQPIIDTSSNEVISCEALIRWIHPVKGLIPPDKFIPFAEESGLIIPIGNWVIDSVCKTYLSWSEETKEKIQTIAINISPKQFNEEGFTNNLVATLNLNSLEPKLLKLELTESVVIDNLENTVDKIKELQLLGFKFAMDDFGTGYSSLSYLKNLPFDFIKIDRSFIQHVLNNKEDASLVKIILSISEQFGFEVIAEGVEEQNQIEFLKSVHCQYYQGYVISKPISSQKFESFLSK